MIFVNKRTDKRILESKLIDLDQNFFEKYHLKIELKYMVEKQTMRHYDSTSLKYNLEETFPKLSTKPYNEAKEKNNRIPFTNDYRKSGYIGICLYLAKCFNAFKIKKVVVEISNETCNRYFQQKTNMFVSIRGLVNNDTGDRSHKIKESILHKKKISLEQFVRFLYVSAHLEYLIQHFLFCFCFIVPLFNLF